MRSCKRSSGIQRLPGSDVVRNMHTRSRVSEISAAFQAMECAAIVHLLRSVCHEATPALTRKSGLIDVAEYHSADLGTGSIGADDEVVAAARPVDKIDRDGLVEITQRLDGNARANV